MKNVFLNYLWSLNEKAKVRKVRNRIIFMLVVVVIGFVIGVCVSYGRLKKDETTQEPEPDPIVTTVDDTIAEENFMLTIDNIQEVLLPASELVSTKYYYTDADTYENYKELFGKKVPFTTDKVVFTYQGVMSVGIDLSAVTYEIDNEKKLIFITIPELQILSNDIDESSFEFPYVSNSIFNATEMSDYVSLVGRLEEEKEKELLENAEFMNEARANTRVILEQFLTASENTKEYDVIFK